MPHQSITEQDLAALIERVSTAAQAYISGDMDTYFSLIHYADDFTLMSPLGGEPARGFDTSPAHIADLKRYFRGGKKSENGAEIGGNQAGRIDPGTSRAAG